MFDNLAFVAIAGILATIADYYLKTWATANEGSTLAAGILLYGISMFIFALSLKTGSLLANGAAYVLVNALGFVFLSQWLFKEVITQTQYAGIFLGLLALILIEI